MSDHESCTNPAGHSVPEGCTYEPQQASSAPQVSAEELEAAKRALAGLTSAPLEPVAVSALAQADAE